MNGTRVYVDGFGDERIVPLRNPNLRLRRLADHMAEHKDELGIRGGVWIEPDDEGYDELHVGWPDGLDGHSVLRELNSYT